MPNARAVTGEDGQTLIKGFDLSNVFVDNMGETIKGWEREVEYKDTTTLRNIIEETGSHIKFLTWNLLANIIEREYNIPLDTEVDLFVSGKVREIRIKKKQYRIFGDNYLGKR